MHPGLQQMTFKQAHEEKQIPPDFPNKQNQSESLKNNFSSLASLIPSNNEKLFCTN